MAQFAEIAPVLNDKSVLCRESQAKLLLYRRALMIRKLTSSEAISFVDSMRLCWINLADLNQFVFHAGSAQ